MSTPKKNVNFQPSSSEDKENGPLNVHRGSSQGQVAEPMSLDNLDEYFSNWEKEKAQYEKKIKEMQDNNSMKKKAISQMRRNNAKTAVEIEQKEVLIKKYDECISNTEALLEPLNNNLLGLNVILSGLNQESNPEIVAEIAKTAKVNRVIEKMCVEYDNQFQQVRSNKMNEINCFKAEYEEIVSKTSDLKERIEEKKKLLNQLNEHLKAIVLGYENDEKELMTIKADVKVKKEEQIEKNGLYKQELESMKRAHEEKMEQKRREIEVVKSQINQNAQEEEKIRIEIDQMKQKIDEQNSSNVATNERISKLQFENNERRQKILERLQRKLQLKKQVGEIDEKKKLQDQKISSEKEANKELLEALNKEMELEAKIDMKKMLIGARKREIDMRKQAVKRKEDLIIEEQHKMKKLCEEITDMKLEVERNEEEKTDIQQSLEALDKEKEFLQESMKNTNKAIIEIRTKKTTLMEELERLKMGSIDRLHSLFNTSKPADKN